VLLSPPEEGSGACPAGMVHVEGAMVDDGGMQGWRADSAEAAQRSACSVWIDRTYPERCLSFDPGRWAALRDSYPRRAMSFCVDRYEWPNKSGAYPWVMVTWPEARDLCSRVGKRLCTEDEWTFACEGEDATPFPYGYERRSSECGLDAPWRKYSSSALAARGSERCSAELGRLWQGKRSGSSPSCASSWGVEDMNGSVEEWTVSTRGGTHPSILKGGYWGPVRTRCRTSTRSHGPGHAFYQQGFRCCKDIASGPRRSVDD